LNAGGNLVIYQLNTVAGEEANLQGERQETHLTNEDRQRWCYTCKPKNTKGGISWSCRMLFGEGEEMSQEA